MQLETQQPTRQAEHDLVFQVRAAQADPAAADTLIGQYMPFIRSETYKFTHAPIEAGHEDELSIATLAFYEAALSYQKGRGAFLPYAAAAIRNRLIDHYRAERRHGGSVSLDAPAGEVYGLVGPNGAGKTTAMKCLAGVLKPESGEVLADGEPVFENPAVKGRIFCIPDEVFHFPQASILDMMRFYRGVYPGFDERRFEQLREVFRLDLKQPMRRFSRGMLKQAAFWLAISIRPELLILDEPVDGLDPVMRRQVWALIMQDVAEYGTTVLISSHNLRELEDVCGRVGIIDRGKMLLERVLSDMQENMTKLQLVLPEGAVLPGELDILHSTGPGRLRTLIIRGRASDVTARLEGLSPIFMEAVPLTLEEIFIYELGGEGHEVRDIIL